MIFLCPFSMHSSSSGFFHSISPGAAHLLDTPAEEAFDRFTRLATQVLRVPVSLISILDSDRQFFKSVIGLQPPFAETRETPLSHSFCQHVVRTGEPLIVADAREHELVRRNLAILFFFDTAKLAGGERGRRRRSLARIN